MIYFSKKPRALDAFSQLGFVLDLDHIEKALKDKIPQLDGASSRSQACALKGLCQHVIRRAKRSKKSRISAYKVLGRLKADNFSVWLLRSMCASCVRYMVHAPVPGTCRREVVSCG